MCGCEHHWDTNAPCACSCPEHEPIRAEMARRAELDEIDRNARAYGWSVGRGHPLVEQIHDVDPENPFLDPAWRDRIEATP